MRTLLCTLMVVASLPLFATPSTLVTIPSTDIQPAGTWHLGMDTTAYLDGGATAPFADLGLTYGVTPRLEAGVDLITPADEPLWLNAKFLVLPGDMSPVPVAVGVYNAGTSSAPINQRILYAVGSYTYSGTRVTFGGFMGREEAFGDDETGILLGVDRTMEKWWLGADYASGDGPIGSWNVGVGYTVAENVGVIIGYDNYNAPGVSDAVNFQVDINL